MTGFKWPLINDNITDDDKQELVNFITTPNVRFTQGPRVREFEEKWSEWQGSKNTTFVNSGASANWIMASALRELVGVGEVIMSPFGWVSDVVPFLEMGFTPVFVDIDPQTMSIDATRAEMAITKQTKAILAVHVLGFNALTQKLLDLCTDNNLILIEDCCESHGATFRDKKVGTYSDMSNFSFYFGHHMTTIEGGAVCTDCDEIHDIVRMLRSHGMTREASKKTQAKYQKSFPDLNPLFTFAVPGYNVRSSEMNAVLGLSQLKRLDENIKVRSDNLNMWLENLSPEKFQTNFKIDGSSNFALPLILAESRTSLFASANRALTDLGIEFRVGASGGGNQVRQPYLAKFPNRYRVRNLLNLDHIHDFGLYIGNHTGITQDMIVDLCKKLNKV